jgi:hypothetical protein
MSTRKDSAKFKAVTHKKNTLHKPSAAANSGRRVGDQDSSVFSTIFTSVLGGGSIGSVFGIPGMVVGAAIGGGVGAMIRKHHV